MQADDQKLIINFYWSAMINSGRKYDTHMCVANIALVRASPSVPTTMNILHMLVVPFFLSDP